MSIVAVAISAAAFGFTVYTWRRQSVVQDRLAAIEEDRRSEELEAVRQADVTAFFEPGSGRGTVNFVILNRGPAVAHDVSFEMTPIDGASPLVGNPSLPLPMLDAGQRSGFLGSRNLDDAQLVDVELSWRDDVGPQRKALRRLNVY